MYYGCDISFSNCNWRYEIKTNKSGVKTGFFCRESYKERGTPSLVHSENDCVTEMQRAVHGLCYRNAKSRKSGRLRIVKQRVNIVLKNLVKV